MAEENQQHKNKQEKKSSPGYFLASKQTPGNKAARGFIQMIIQSTAEDNTAKT